MSKTKKEETPTVEAAEVKEEVKSPRELREEEVAMARKEIAQVLEKYQCRMTAQIILGENKMVPQVFVIDNAKG